MQRHPQLFRVPTTLALLALLMATTAAAVDVRQPEGGASLQLEFVRAYAPCLAPNTIARNGAPACDSPVTSVCSFSPGTLGVIPPEFAQDPTIPGATLRVQVNGSQAICRNGDATFAIGVRTTTDVGESEGESGDTPACESRHCTFPDVALTESSPFFSLFADAHGDRDPNYELVDIAIDGPDGLPLAGLGIDYGHSFTTNLTLPYARCTAPGPDGACDLVPSSSPCDFEIGAIEWQRLNGLGASFAHVVMRDLAGASPLCTIGPYHLEATLRVKGNVCGTPERPSSCLVADQSVSAPLTVQGRKIDAVVKMPLGNLGIYDTTKIESVGIVAARIVDPTGATVAVPGITGVRSLIAPRLSISGDRLRVRATIPVNEAAPSIDPTLEGGATLTLNDRDGVFYTVTIPPTRWQDQTPLGSRWTYADPGGVLGGVRKALLKRLGKPEARKGYVLDLRAEGLDLSGADVPSITVSVAIARPDVFGGDPQLHRAQRNCTGVFKGPKLECK